jgi:putative FmdB family regulatory protein
LPRRVFTRSGLPAAAAARHGGQAPKARAFGYDIPFLIKRFRAARPTDGAIMPIYEYRCSSCGHELEALQKFSDAPLSTCPSCNADTLVKRVSAAGFQLKGSGWYATDFKGSGSKPAASKEGGKAPPDAKADAAGAPKGESRAESKGETKTEGASATTTPASGSGAPPATA